MAVYTQVSAEDAQIFVNQYGLGDLVALKGIAEGVENSNYLLETTQGRYFLTLYESRVDQADLPFFHALLSQLKESGCLVPAFINDLNGQWLHELCGRPACLIEFLEGVSLSNPTQNQAFAVGIALGEMHGAVSSFKQARQNSMGPTQWRALAQECGNEGLNRIQSGLSERINAELDYIESAWPKNLPKSIIHADLFPDNVLMLGDKLTGLIDFYFACTDIRALDIAITHSAWSFSSDGAEYYPEIGKAIFDGYRQSHGISQEETAALATLFRGACLRFLLTRCYDWINVSQDAIVYRKDPLHFLNRLDFYSEPANIAAILGSN